MMTIGHTVKTPTGKTGELLAIYPATFEHPARAEVRITVAIVARTHQPRPTRISVLYRLDDLARVNDEVTR